MSPTDLQQLSRSLRPPHPRHAEAPRKGSRSMPFPLPSRTVAFPWLMATATTHLDRPPCRTTRRPKGTGGRRTGQPPDSSRKSPRPQGRLQLRHPSTWQVDTDRGPCALVLKERKTSAAIADHADDRRQQRNPVPDPGPGPPGPSKPPAAPIVCGIHAASTDRYAFIVGARHVKQPEASAVSRIRMARENRNSSRSCT